MRITRRTALATGAAAITTAAITAPIAFKAAGVKAALTGEPLVALEADLMEARTAGERTAAVWSAAYDKAGSWAFGWPRTDFSTPAMAKMRGWYERTSWPGKERVVALSEIREFNRHTEILVFVGGGVLAECKAEGRERIRWWIKTRRAQFAAQEAAGMPEVDALMDRGHEHVDTIEAQLWNTPAETMQGVLIRLREAHRDYVAVQCGGDSGEDFYAKAFGKVLADLERLSGETSL